MLDQARRRVGAERGPVVGARGVLRRRPEGGAFLDRPGPGEVRRRRPLAAGSIARNPGMCAGTPAVVLRGVEHPVGGSHAFHAAAPGAVVDQLPGLLIRGARLGKLEVPAVAGTDEIAAAENRRGSAAQGLDIGARGSGASP